jgi:hypothetical protein
MQCPLCHTELPDGATQCTRCDWSRRSEPPSHHDDWIAAGLSFVPGVGHLYKGHLVPGILLLCVLGPLYLAIVFWLVPKTYGASLLLPAFFVVLVGWHAFHLPRVHGSQIEEQAANTLRNWQDRLRK